MVLKALEKYFGNIISDDIYEVQRISLCQKVVQVNPDKHSAEIEPVWECRVLVKTVIHRIAVIYKRFIFMRKH